MPTGSVFHQVTPFLLMMKADGLNILDTGVRSASENMRLDSELLKTLDPAGLPILHFYDWEGDSATYGHFINPADFLDLEGVKKRGLHLGRRPTGGGIVFHIWDLAFSVLIPSEHPKYSKNTLDNYAFINRVVLSAVNAFLEARLSLELISQDAQALDAACSRFCMAQPTKYDVVLKGKKIAGAAQRKTKRGFLHQGTISLQIPSEEYLKSVLLADTKVLDAMKANTFTLLGPGESLKEGRRALREELQKQFTQEIEYVTKT